MNVATHGCCMSVEDALQEKLSNLPELFIELYPKELDHVREVEVELTPEDLADTATSDWFYTSLGGDESYVGELQLPHLTVDVYVHPECEESQLRPDRSTTLLNTTVDKDVIQKLQDEKRDGEDISDVLERVVED